MALLVVAALSACATTPMGLNAPVDLHRPPVQFSQGRVVVVLTDEYGITMPGMRVDLAWEEPSFYRTSAFTNRNGEVTFSGIPEVAEISINHPGGLYSSVLLVPQSGRPELRLMLQTMGGGELMRQQERERLAPRTSTTQAR
jgi:hypothetical protein